MNIGYVDLDRRAFLRSAAAPSAVVLAGRIAAPSIARGAVPHELPPLPYADTALEPAISANTIGFHYGKHHATYVATLNKLLGEPPTLAELPFLELLKTTAV